MKKIIFVLSIMLFLAGCKNKEDKLAVIAEFQNGTVTLDELASRYSLLSDGEKQQMKTKDDIFKLVRQIALEKIIIQQAAVQGLDKQPENLEQMEKIRQETGYDILQQKNVIKKVNITETDYAEYTKLYETYQIVKRTDILDENQKKSARRLLTDLSENITDLEQFKKAAALHSDDLTRNRGGFIGKIRSGIMEDEINSAMKTVKPGTVSKVIETYVGYHLIFINSIEKVDIDTLLEDKELYEIIRNKKIEKIELEWYDKMLASPKVTIRYDLMKEKTRDQTAVVTYKDKTLTRQEILERVDQLRQDGAFPEPTPEELKNLVRTMALNMIIEYEISQPAITGTSKYKEQVETESRYLMINSFIRQNLEAQQVSEKEIRQFYEENRKTLFTFKTADGKEVVQEMAEVIDFIKQKLQGGKVQQSRYALYRQLVTDHKLTIDETYLESFLMQIAKQ